MYHVIRLLGNSHVFRHAAASLLPECAVRHSVSLIHLIDVAIVFIRFYLNGALISASLTLICFLIKLFPLSVLCNSCCLSLFDSTFMVDSLIASLSHPYSCSRAD